MTVDHSSGETDFACVTYAFYYILQGSVARCYAGTLFLNMHASFSYVSLADGVTLVSVASYVCLQ